MEKRDGYGGLVRTIQLCLNGSGSLCDGGNVLEWSLRRGY